MVRTRLALALSLCLALAITSQASAGSITAEIVGYKGGTIKVQYGDTTVSGAAGIFLWDLQSDDGNLLPYNVGDQFISFCIEAAESVPMYESLQYAVVDANQAPNVGWAQMGDGKADALARWFGAYFKGKTLAAWTPIEAMAFQMGVWEIVAETDDVFDLTDGYLLIHNQPTARDLAQSWLDDLGWQDPDAKRLSLKALSSPWEGVTGNIQDQIIVVPLPAPMLAGGVMLAGIGVQRWRRGRV